MKPPGWIPGLLIAGIVLVSCSRSGPNANLVARWSSATNSIVPNLLMAAPKGGVRIVSNARGSGWYFDGKNAALLVADSSALHFGKGQNFTITAWIRPQTNNNSFGVSSIVEKRQVSGIAAALGFSLHLEYGCLACQLAPSPPVKWRMSDFTTPGRFKAAWARRSSPGSVYRFVSNGPVLTDGKFHHVALSVDRRSPTGGKLFVDGIVVKTFDPTQLPGNLSNKQPMIIGNHPDSTLTCGFSGAINEVSIYRRALGEKEIEQASHLR
jgi:hypothetical protein